VRKTIEDRGGSSSIVIASVQNPRHHEWVGKTLEEISSQKGVPSDEAALEMLVDEKLQIVAIYHAMSQGDVERAMAHPLQTVGSDGIMGAFSHPRTFGTFPRIIRYFSLERKLFPLEEAVRKMTSAPARRLRLMNRGHILPDYYADLILFSPENFQDRATFERPAQLASGLDWVLVNGVAVVEEGKLCERNSGQILRRR
jgi:N-acyl-D-amino-acid deacylase